MIPVTEIEDTHCSPFAHYFDFASFDDEKCACSLAFNVGPYIRPSSTCSSCSDILVSSRNFLATVFRRESPILDIVHLAADPTDHRIVSVLLQDDGEGDGGGFFNAVGGILSVNGGNSDFQDNVSAVRQTSIS